MPFHDLNVPYSNHAAETSQTLTFLHELGYRVIALSVPVTGKLPSKPTALPLPPPKSYPQSLTLLTRITLTISDPSQNHRLSSLQSSYDIVALRPTEEKAFALACNSLDCDLISLDLSQRIPFLLRFKTVSAALKRGVRFEICYAPGVAGAGGEARRNLISGATALIRATRGRGLILSSEARGALECRAPWDVINLASLWGLGPEKGKEAVCEEAAKMVRLAHMKRWSYRGVVEVLDGVGKVQEETEDGTINQQVKGSAQGKSEVQKAPSTTLGTAAYGMKRKASTHSICDKPNGTAKTTATSQEKLLSQREKKKRARLARRQQADGSGEPSATEEKQNDLPIEHETVSKKRQEVG